MVKFRSRSRHYRRPARHLRRALARRLSRRLDRASLRPGRRSGPDELSQALAAFSRAIRCHRRLARLAPEFFDATTVDRAVRHRAEQRRWMALWKPALDKVYGPDPVADSAPDPGLELPSLPGRRTQRAVERELAGWDFWMTAGRAALDRRQKLRPHALCSLSQLARLISVAFEFKQLACGHAAADPPSAFSDHSPFWSDLERAYGHRCESPSAPPPVPPATQNPASATGHGSAAATTTPAWPPPDDRRDLVPHALVVGSHGLLCLQPIVPC